MVTFLLVLILITLLGVWPQIGGLLVLGFLVFWLPQHFDVTFEGIMVTLFLGAPMLMLWIKLLEWKWTRHPTLIFTLLCIGSLGMNINPEMRTLWGFFVCGAAAYPIVLIGWFIRKKGKEEKEDLGLIYIQEPEDRR